MLVLGVDGRAEAWIVVALDEGRFAGAGAFGMFAEVLEAMPELVSVAVNLPVGMTETGPRLCDALARELVGPACRAHVPVVPPRSALAADTLQEAKRRSRLDVGEAVNRALYAVRRRVFELQAVTEELLAYVDHGVEMTVPPDGAPLAVGPVIEGNPELTFMEIAGRRLSEPPKTDAGTRLRRDLLYQAGVYLPAAAVVGGVPVDSLLDAAALAITASRYAHGQARSIPPAALFQRDSRRTIALWR